MQTANFVRHYQVLLVFPEIKIHNCCSPHLFPPVVRTTAFAHKLGAPT